MFITLLEIIDAGDLRTWLDLAGLTAVLGIFPDAANTVYYLVEGDVKNAAYSGMALVPIVGNGSTVTK